MESLKIRALIGLGIVWIAVLTEAMWIWGILFLVWVLPDLRTGTTYFFQAVPRSTHPVQYWAIVLTWLILSAYLLLDLLPATWWV